MICVEVEVLGVDEPGVRAAVREHRVVEVGAGVEHTGAARSRSDRPQREQVGRAGAGADEVDGHRLS